MKDDESFSSIDPEVRNGARVFRGTQVPLTTLVDTLDAAGTVAEFLEGYPTVSRAQVVAFLVAEQMEGFIDTADWWFTVSEAEREGSITLSVAAASHLQDPERIFAAWRNSAVTEIQTLYIEDRIARVRSRLAAGDRGRQTERAWLGKEAVDVASAECVAGEQASACIRERSHEHLGMDKWLKDIDAMFDRMQTPEYAEAMRRMLDAPLRVRVPQHLRMTKDEQPEVRDDSGSD